MLKTFDERALDVEILVRGQVLKECAMTEHSLLRMIIFCNEEKKQIDIEVLNFKELMFSQKIDKAQKLLRQRYLDTFKSNKDVFSELHDIREFRNLIAHSVFNFDKSLEHPTSFTVWHIVVPPDDTMQFHIPIEYTIKDVSTIVSRIRENNRRLLEINIIIEDSFKRRFPGFLR